MTNEWKMGDVDKFRRQLKEWYELRKLLIKLDSIIMSATEGFYKATTPHGVFIISLN